MNITGLIRSEQSLWFKLWLIAFALLFLVKVYESYYPDFKHDQGHYLQSQCQTELNQLRSLHQKLISQIPKFKDEYNEFDKLLNQLGEFIQQNKEFNKQHIIICLGDQLIYWDQNESYYDNSWCPCQEESGEGFFNQDGSNYFGIKSQVNLGDQIICITHYEKILSNEEIPDSITITNEKVTATQLPLVNSKLKPIGFIDHAGIELGAKYSNIVLSLFLIIIIILFIPFHLFCKKFFNERNYGWGILVWVIGMLFTISLSQWMVHDTEFYDSFLTHSKINTLITSYTLFEFIILTLLLFHFSFIFNKYYIIPSHQSNLGFSSKIIPFINYFTILLSLSLYCSIYKSVFHHSKFYFDLDKLAFMPLENYFLMASLITLILTIFLISSTLNASTKSFGLPFKQRLSIVAVAILFFYLLFPYLNLDLAFGPFTISALIILLLQDFFSDYKQNNTLWLISWILIISFLTSSLVFHYQNNQKRKIKSEIINSISQSKLPSEDTTLLNQTTFISELIHQANAKQIDLFVFENENLKYSTNYNIPDYSWVKRSLGIRKETDIRNKNIEYLIFKTKGQYTILLAHQIPSIIKAVSLFSYLFTVLIILSYLLSLFNQKYKFLPDNLQLQINERPSLRNRIQFYVILSIVASFLTIALITVFFTKKSEEEITKENIYNKISYFSKIIENSLTGISNKEDAELIIKSQIANSYSLFDYKIQYFDQLGLEKPLLKNQNLQSTKVKLCDPSFYFKFEGNTQDILINKYTDDHHSDRIAALRNILLNNQKIGTLKMSTSLVTSAAGDSRLTNLINTLLNIYVFLFLLSASLATILANSITSPLEVLSNRLKQMRLGKKNESLEWKGQDEIGELIKDYNRMVEQLEESVALLSKSERDSAWREMAKQVAHEIKNPLTPMKLNIQYLQQQIKDGRNDVTELAKNVAESLLEQIEGLTKIASEFSHFAKMPTAENEKILLNELVSSVHDLFRKRDDIDILLNVTIDELYIFCDRTQMIRVLNNLINNAIQSIPDHRRGKIDILLQKKGNRAQISISDNGIGIPESMREKIFLPNFTTKNSGTGLGLAMCQQIIDSANGKITFHSEENIGTTFIVVIPLMKTDFES